jgi:hypothetical protein
VFKNLTMRRAGNVDGPGGAVQALTANVQLTHCVVSDNLALKGGGIYAEAGNVTLINTNVSRNVSDGNGGGINLGSGTLVLTNGTLRHNQGGVSGGGLGHCRPPFLVAGSLPQRS